MSGNFTPQIACAGRSDGLAACRPLWASRPCNFRRRRTVPRSTAVLQPLFHFDDTTLFSLALGSRLARATGRHALLATDELLARSIFSPTHFTFLAASGAPQAFSAKYKSLVVCFQITACQSLPNGATPGTPQAESLPVVHPQQQIPCQFSAGAFGTSGRA